ncbi:MAG: dynamin family protein [Kiritimatiellae bacterium]|nr:dynamin family protein [Kiritimatiellia bacterium]
MKAKDSLSPEKLLERMRKLSPWLCQKAEEHFYDEALLYTFRSEISGLEKNIQLARDKARKLSIGIIGQVKAGKSSFLNTVIFDGRQILPKAATPMTAALTKISYSDTPTAIVHYYSIEEWDNLENANKSFLKNLENAYSAYKKKIEDDAQKNGGRGKTLLSIDDYEKKIFRTTQPDMLQAGRELVQMVKDKSILDKLGESKELNQKSQDALMGQLKEYVGADGKYTPIVSYVELMLPDDKLKDLSIIDTPGLNDPITSRTLKTKEFLRECDVAFLLSPCSQFMDVNTIELMAKRLPDAGIKNIVVVGSKLDSGLLNMKGKDFKFAYTSSIKSYEKGFLENINRVKRHSIERGVIDSFVKNEIAEKPIFFSSFCYLIDKALKNKESLQPGSEEETAYRNLQSLKGFPDSVLYQLSGLDKIKDAMKRVLAQKEEIISGKNATFLEKAWRNVLGLLGQIQQGAYQLKKDLEELEEDSPEHLKKRYDAMDTVLNSSRAKITALFETAGFEAEKSAVGIKRNCGMEMGNYDSFKVETHTEEEIIVEPHVLKPDTVVKTTTKTYIADTAQVITNVRGYADKCLMHADEGFSSLFNEENLKRRLIAIITDAFKQSGYNYDVDDILIPLETVFAQISIPQITVDHHACIDKLNSYFPHGSAQNSDVHTLHTLQVECLSDIAQEIENQVDGSVKAVKLAMTKQAATFVDQICTKLKATKEKLLGMIKNKENNLKNISDFIENIKMEKEKLAQEM